MADPMLWLAFTGMFVLAGLLNLWRAGAQGSPRRPIRRALAGSCFLWALGAYVFRFGSVLAGGLVAGAAAVLMLYAGLLSGRINADSGGGGRTD